MSYIFNANTFEGILMKSRLFSTCLVLGLLFPVTSTLQGCMAIPVLLAGNMVAKSGTANFTLEGKAAVAMALFRDATIKAGGMITNSGANYAKAEFSDTAVKVEIQTVKPGEYQVISSSNTSVARSWELKDNIGETGQKIVDYMASNGFKVTSNSRNRGI